ncbi:hypothetical protein V5799_020162 [Amblyomma americanum]|uniref:Uncharacterized protein n=1 Tax=Amblyomma americanum TaxID=6943 RepID=A0AAQ4EV80_AMBAM
MFGEVWVRYFNLLSSSAPNGSKPRVQPARQRIFGTFAVQTRVVQMLFSSTGSRRSIIGAEQHVSQAFTFAQIARKTAVFTTKRIEVILNKNFEMIYPLVGSDLLVTSDVAYLEKAFNIFKEFTKEVLLDALGWWLVVSSGVYVALPQRFNYAQNMICAVHAEDVYKLLLAAERATTLFTDADRTGLEEFASRTVRSALETSLAGPTSERNSSEAAAKLQGSFGASLSGGKVKVKLWPDSNHIFEERLVDYFMRFPGGDKDLYVEQWIYAKRNASRMLSKYVYNELSRLPHFYYDLPIAYDLPHNTIVVSPTALSEPLYFSDGTDFMLHGSLGSVLATKTASLVACNGGKSERACGYPAMFDSTAAWRYTIQDVNGHLTTCEQTGVEVAYGQFVNASSQSSSAVLESFLMHSPKQLFFMVWCYIRCFDSGFRVNSDVCDKAVMDMEAFHEAFHCKNSTS